jgi:hypothetical protein
MTRAAVPPGVPKPRPILASLRSDTRPDLLGRYAYRRTS